MCDSFRIGITGANGFIGSHLQRHLAMRNDMQPVPFVGDLLGDRAALRQFVAGCDAIVHLAGINRHESRQTLYDTNLELARVLIEALEAERASPHLVFSSSTQEEQDNVYGKSKRESRRLYEAWAVRAGARFTGMVIPNVFGPFGKPNYNSVVATFCHKITHDEKPEILTDGSIKLIYVDDLCREIIRAVEGQIDENPFYVSHRTERRVSAILDTLNHFKDQYLTRGFIPKLQDDFDVALFNTFLCYVEHNAFFPFRLAPHQDSRGRFVEVLKLNDVGGQVSFSTTVPGVTRGNHFHTRKLERFAVLKGQARIQIRKVGDSRVTSFELSGDEPAFVDMPVWHTHNITNIGDEELYTLFWTNEFFDPADPDTFFELV